MIIKKEFTADFGHRLPNHQGKCFNVHGHTYRFILYVEGDLKSEGPEAGMVLDFGNLKPIKDRVDQNWDHGFVYRKGDPIGDTIKASGFKVYEMDCDPTAENMAKFLSEKFDILKGVEVYETPTSSALFLKN